MAIWIPQARAASVSKLKARPNQAGLFCACLSGGLAGLGWGRVAADP